MSYMHYATGRLMQWVNTLDRQEWLIVLAVGMLLGFLCMRGFGSRSHY